MSNDQELDVIEAFGDAMGLYARHWKVPVIVGVGTFLAMGLVLAVLIEFVAAGGAPWVIGLATTLLITVGTALLAGMLVLFASDVHEGRPEPSVGALIKRILPVAVPLALTSVLLGLLLALVGLLQQIPFIGTIVWFVAAVFLGVSFAFSTVVVVAERRYFANALHRSWQLVIGTGNWIPTALLMLLVGGVTFLGSAVLAIIVRSIMPIDLLADWLGYASYGVLMPVLAFGMWTGYAQIASSEPR